MKRSAIFVAWNTAVLVATFLSLEVGLGMLLKYPPGSESVLEPLRDYYTRADRSVLQYVPDCSMWDEKLGYTLKPGQCRFSNREFETTISVNRAGMRDDEQSLEQPRIAVVGDSHAMGWGVNDDDTFPQLVETELNCRVLNAAVSSYGTARELMLLERAELSSLEWLIVQYCPNDIGENLEYLNGSRCLKTMSRDRYRELVSENRERTRYHLGKHVQLLLPGLVRWASGFGNSPNSQPDSPRNVKLEARVFLDVLDGDWSYPPGARILVVEINKLNENGSAFVEAVRQTVERPEYKARFASVDVLDLSLRLSRSNYFAYDGHMNASGHIVVAEAMTEYIRDADSAERNKGVLRSSAPSVP